MPRRNRRSSAQKEQWKRRREATERRGTEKEVSVRASFSQSDDRFPEHSRGNQSLANSLMFLVHLQESDEIVEEGLDDVLRTGDRLYCEIRQRLEDSKRFVNRYLNFDDVPDTVETDGGCYTVVKSNPLNGLLLQNAPDGWENSSNLSLQLESLGSTYSQALLIVGGLCVGVFKDRRGRYGFFDPHCCEDNGKAVMVSFLTVTDLAERLVQLFYCSLNYDEDKEYNLLPIHFETVTTKDCNTDKGAVKPIQGSVAQNDTLLHKMLMKLRKFDKIRRVAAVRKLKALLKKQQSLNVKEKRSAEEKAQMRKDAVKEKRSTEEKAQMRKDAAKARYRLHSAQRQAELRARYRDDPEYRMRRKQYMRDRYRNDPSFKQRQIQRSRIQYIKNREERLARNDPSATWPQDPTLPNTHWEAQGSVQCSRTTLHSTTEQISNENLSGPIITQVESLCEQNIQQAPVHTCTICQRLLIPNQRPSDSKDPEIKSVCSPGSYVHVCGDRCAEKGACIMPEVKEEWICHNCNENLVTVIV